MDLASLTSGVTSPDDIFAVVENPRGNPVKYEVDKASGVVFVDRFLHTAMSYPGDYGLIPHTSSEDGDPCDVLVISPVAVIPGAVIRCRPVGALLMHDEAGPDEKIVAVPIDKLHSHHPGVNSHNDLPRILCEKISHFFAHHKDLEPRKWSVPGEWVGPDEARRLIQDAISRYDALGEPK